MNILASELISKKRKNLGVSPKELADILGLDKDGDKLIRSWEKGEAYPSLDIYEQISALTEKIPFPNNTLAPFKAIDLFCGIGGTRLGFHLTNQVQFVMSSEIDKYAVKTYKANFGEEPLGDISKLSADLIPDHDILIGGFPCQAFSQAGLKKGFDDARGTLFFEIARILKAKRPKAFLLENVKNLVTHDKGNTFKVILSVLEELNYHVYFQVLKARDFGVPQNRERIYIVGFDKNTIEDHDTFKFPTPLNLATRVGDILEPEVHPKYTISDKLWQGHQTRKERNKQQGKGFGYCLFNADSPYTNTISARYYKDGSEILIEQLGQNPRKLTPREAARLQGFPDNFVIRCSDTQSYKQFGNSVAVPVINTIAKQILNILHKNLDNSIKDN